jgi:radical SAM protein with 4Fe4S-binding SPASM domain
MPDVARSMGIKEVNIVPYYYVPEEVGKTYEEELKSLGSSAYSWKGFHHDNSGIEPDVFSAELKKYKAGLGEVKNGQYMPLKEQDLKVWFSDALSPVGRTGCNNIENLMDIQPDGNVNFCIDYPDYSFGNVLKSTLGEIWNSPQAEKFREYRRNKPLAVCHRCGAKYITEG